MEPNAAFCLPCVFRRFPNRHLQLLWLRFTVWPRAPKAREEGFAAGVACPRFRRSTFSRMERDAREAAVKKQLEVSVGEYLAPVDAVNNAIELFLDATHTLPARQGAVGVQMRILARLQGDIRVCCWAAQHGYAMAAASQASVIFELAFAIAYIRNDPVRAAEWNAHRDPFNAYPRRVKDAVKEFAEVLELPTDWADQVYGVYQNLCLAKHGNPLLQRAQGVFELGDELVIAQLPIGDDNSVKLSQFALLHSGRLTIWILEQLTVWHLDSVPSALCEHAAAAVRLSLIAPQRALGFVGNRDGWLRDPPVQE